MSICRTLTWMVFSALLAVSAPWPAGAQQDDGLSGDNPELAGARRGFALVIGNETYSNLPDVAGSTADAAAVAIYLRQLGFEVSQHVNLSQGELLAASQRFIGQLRAGELAVFYFAGHVLQLKGNNFLVPSNARVERPTSLLAAALPLNAMIARIEQAELAGVLFFLEGGLAIDPAGDGGLAIGMAEPPEMSIPAVFALAVEPDATIAVADPTLGDFTAAVLLQATLPGVSISDALIAARDEMAVIRGNGPPPWVRDNLSEPLVLTPATQTPNTDDGEQRIWNRILRQPTDRERLISLTAYMELYPDGVHAQEAQRMLDAIAASGGPDPGTGEPPGDNLPPRFDPPPLIVVAAGGAPLDLGLPSPTDPNGDPLSIEIVALPGSVTILREDAPLTVGDVLTESQMRTLVLLPGDEADEDDALTLAISDPSGATVRASIHFQVTARENRPPVALDLAALGIAADAEPISLNIPPPSDPDGDPLTITVSEVPRFGQVRTEAGPVAVDQTLPVEALATLIYTPSQGQSGDAGRLGLTVEDPHGGQIRFNIPITVTPAPTAEGALPWDAARAATDDLRLAQRALQSLDLYDGSLDGLFGRGSQTALERYLQTLNAENSATLTQRQRAELAVAGAEAMAETARAVAVEAEAAAARAQEISLSDDAVEVSWAAGLYRGEVNGTTLEGYGVLQAANGQSFAGLFANNEPKLGVHRFESDSRYAGEERDRVPHGLGVYEYSSGVVFAGEWDASRIQGLGVSVSSGGVTVAGEWTDNAPNGHGAVSDAPNGRRIGRMEAGRFIAVY